MKLQHLLEPLLTDFRTVIAANGLEWNKLDHGKGLKACHLLLDKVSFDRAYKDNHPAFVAGRNRLLPFDGRNYCFYYDDNANDTHLATLLQAIKKQLDIEYNVKALSPT